MKSAILLLILSASVCAQQPTLDLVEPPECSPSESEERDLQTMSHPCRRIIFHHVRSVILQDHSGAGLTREQVYIVLKVAHELERGPYGLQSPSEIFGEDVPAAMRLIETRFRLQTGYSCTKVGCFPPGYLGPG